MGSTIFKLQLVKYSAKADDNSTHEAATWQSEKEDLSALIWGVMEWLFLHANFELDFYSPLM